MFIFPHPFIAPFFIQNSRKPCSFTIPFDPLFFIIVHEKSTLTKILIPHTVLFIHQLTGGAGIHVVLDTNIVYSGLYSIHGASYRILKAMTHRSITPVLSVALLFEYEDVLKRNSRKLGFSHPEIDSFLDNLCGLSVFQKTHYLWRPFLPDPKDDLVLELAVASGVGLISTFNIKDFKGSEQFGVRTVEPKKLLEDIKWVL